ncbi:MarC family protein [Kitasatospora sp. NPDC093679]|uniref:MarC family protein n=1 Tax=Kitasatospora sp. NPDC093679 TaxID=3154983 RepID=UPI00342D113E
MRDLTTVTAFVTFFAVIGPQKVLIAFARLSRTRTIGQMRRLTMVSSVLAAAVGILMAYTAEVLTSFFHVSDQSLQLAGGVIFFIYAVALVMGIHLGEGEEEDEDSLHPMFEGVRELLLPYIVSPLAVTAELLGSLDENTWGWRTTVAGMYVLVIAIDCVCVLLLAPLLQRTHGTVLEVLSRLLGLLLAAVGVEVFLSGLESLGVHLSNPHY